MRCLLIFLLIFLIFPHSAYTSGETDIGGSFRLITQYAYNPDDDFIYPDRRDYRVDLVARQFLEGNLGDRVAFQVNIYETFTHLKSTRSLTTLLNSAVERSSTLESNLFDDSSYSKGVIAIDRLNMRFSSERVDLTMGRQAINMATTFHFTPNDFFAPFSANNFYRVYKSGVDAIRGEVRIDDLTQLSIIAVLGYEEDADSSTGWSGNPNEGRNSYLGRISTSLANFEWSLLGGKVRREKVLGVGLQGEIAEWLGVRGEGHYAKPDDSAESDYSEVSLGLEHRFENELFLRFEHFYNGKGGGSVEAYSISATSLVEHRAYLAERYSALSANYQFTPLLVGDAAYIRNHIDNSSLISFNGIYSLSDESELSGGINIPIGEEPEGGILRSEFGLLPVTLSVEYRVYF